MESKYGLVEESSFEFKYVPESSKRTEMEDRPKLHLSEPGVERRNLKAFVIASCFVFVLAYLTFKSFLVLAQIPVPRVWVLIR